MAKKVELPTPQGIQEREKGTRGRPKGSKNRPREERELNLKSKFFAGASMSLALGLKTEKIFRTHDNSRSVTLAEDKEGVVFLVVENDNDLQVFKSEGDTYERSIRSLMKALEDADLSF